MKISNNVVTQNNQKTKQKPLNIINRAEGICIKNKIKTNQKVPKKNIKEISC